MAPLQPYAVCCSVLTATRCVQCPDKPASAVDPATWCLGDMFIRIKRCLFLADKMQAMGGLLSNVCVPVCLRDVPFAGHSRAVVLRHRFNRVPVQDGGMQEIVIDRPKAVKAREKLEAVDTSAMDSLGKGGCGAAG